MILIPLCVVIVLLLTGLRIAQEFERGVIFRLGHYVGLRGPGLYWIIPLGIERSATIDIRTKTVSAEQQETITRDSVTIKVNAVLCGGVFEGHIDCPEWGVPKRRYWL